MPQALTGALIGWRHRDTAHGVALTMQVAPSVTRATGATAEKVTVVLNDRQLRSLTRDLARVMKGRGLDLHARRPWWRLWRRQVSLPR